MRIRLFVLLVALLTATVSALAQDGYVPQFEPVDDCFIELPDDIPHDCGHVTVPEFYDGESARDLQLGVVRLKAASETPGTPLFMLTGGPGQSINEFLGSLPTLIASEPGGDEAERGFTRILENHDIVFMAQRGTEFTDTVLSCPELGSLPYAAYEQHLDAAASETLFTETLQRCVDNLVAQGINFNAYNTEANAADVASVVRALGYDQIIYYGESYGAQLGQFVMRDYPSILEAAVLDGANALSKTSWVQDRAQAVQTALENVAALCAERPACAEAYGDLNTVIDAAIAQFDNGPIPYTFQHPEDPDIRVEIEITFDTFATYIASQFSFLGNFGIPSALQQISEGNLESLGIPTALGILGSQGATSNTPILMQFAMVCSDDPVFSDKESDAEGVSSLAIAAGRGEAHTFTVGCSIVHVEQLPASSDVDVSLDIPVLLFGGGLDTRTPVVRNQEVADHLPNARLIVFPVGSHVQVPNMRCANQILAAFVDDPSALASLDTTCIEQFTSAFEFVLPGE
ncbi:MAG: alpha/beta fold hydrolase [Anaerolineae bacterium]|nr:alpha/beta fold hydrolase [Anaerolineae bacterium]